MVLHPAWLKNNLIKSLLSKCVLQSSRIEKTGREDISVVLSEKSKFENDDKLRPLKLIADEAILKGIKNENKISESPIKQDLEKLQRFVVKQN